MTESPEVLVDIVMPYYGDVAMMREAVLSVLAQEDSRWRLTVVDDGVEPGVPEWFATLIAERGDERVRYLRNRENLGIVGNFQRCLDLARAEFVTMIGCDDRMLPNYVGTVLDLYEKYPEASQAQPGVEVIDGSGNVVLPLGDRMKRKLYAPKVVGTAEFGGEELAVSLLRGNWTYFPSICWRTKPMRAIGFDQSLTICQDLAVTMELVRGGSTLAVGDTVCFSYRRHELSESSAQAFSGARFVEERAFFLAQAKLVDQLGWKQAARAGRRHFSSRLHAGSLLPGAILGFDAHSALSLFWYAFGPAR